MKHRDQIGFSQRIQLDWLEYAANLVLAGSSRDEIVAALNDRLQKTLSIGNNPERGNRNKAITILTKIWATVPGEFLALRDEGLTFLQQSNVVDRMLVHWCMCMTVYPFFGAVADATGRLLHLQGTAGAAQVQRRIRERLGERETVARAARRVLRVFVDWGVILETSEKGIYCSPKKYVIDDLSLAIWIIKAMLVASDGTYRPASTVLRGPYLFPFDIALPSIKELEACETLDVTRHGLDHEIFVGLVEDK